jgi:hypothetical protein
MKECPDCGSTHTRLGGNAIWTIYMIALLVAVPAVLLLHLNAAIVAGILTAIAIIAHLLLTSRVCLDCGHQWKAR